MNISQDWRNFSFQIVRVHPKIQNRLKSTRTLCVTPEEIKEKILKAHHDSQRGKRRGATEREGEGRGRKRWGEVREGEKAGRMKAYMGDSLFFGKLIYLF